MSREKRNRGQEPAATLWGRALELDRRDFLKSFGAGIFVFFSLEIPPSKGQESRGRGYPTDPNAYLRIGEDGRVTVYSGKIEMGQGIVTSLAQMAADELGVALEAVDMIMGDTQVCPFDMGTYGSMSTRFFGPALRGAAAEARTVLIGLAAERLRIPAGDLRVERGIVFAASDRSKRVSFAQLAGGRTITRKSEGKTALKSPSEFSLMGKPAKRTDAVVKVTGKAVYAGDVRLPGMLYARVLRPPAHGAQPKTVDTTAAEKLPGVTVVKQDGMVAVLHPDPEMAARALGAVKADFELPAPAADNRTIFDYLVAKAPGGAGERTQG